MARILALHAHPDDCEILAGGTLALLSGAGHAVTIVTITSGDCGSDTHTAEEISAIRAKEAARSAAIIGAEYRCAGFSDLAFFNDDTARRQVVEIVRTARPDVVLTASPADYMADHEVASALVRDACFAAPIRLYRTGLGDAAAPLAAIPHLYHMSPLGRANWPPVLPPPDFGVDVISVFRIKKEMLAQHASQRDWLRKQHGIDEYLNQMERWTRETGRAWGVPFAEEFRQRRGHPYPESPLLQELLGNSTLLRREKAKGRRREVRHTLAAV
jgi:N-acetylglucosamine malate deacetylase 1